MIPGPTILLFDPDDSERKRWREALAGAALLHECTDLDGLQRALEYLPTDVIVAPPDVKLLAGIQAVRGETRLLLCGEQLPNPILDAIANGADIHHTKRPDHLRREVHALARPRSLMIRHQLHGLLVRWEGSADKSALLDISNGGLSFRLELDDELERLLPGVVLNQVSVERNGAVGLEAEAMVVRYVDQVQAQDGEYYRIGCEFLPATQGAHATKAIRVTDDAARGGLLRAALRSSGLTVESSDGNGVMTTCEEGQVDLELSELRLEAPFSPFEPHDVVRGSFELGGGSYHFLAAVKTGTPLVLSLPHVIEGAHRRSSSRYRPPPERPISVDLRSPLLGGAFVRRALLELSSTGFSFLVAPAVDVFPPGMRFSALELRLQELELRCAGVVRNLSPLSGQGNAYRCGVVFEGLTLEQRAQLADAVTRHRFPGLGDGGSIPVSELWSFFEETKFVYPSKLAALAPVLPEVMRTFNTLRTAPPRLFKSLIYREEGKVYAHLSSVRAYRRTWIVQHLAGAMRLRGRQGPQIVNLGVAEYFAQNPELEYVKVFFRPNNKWPARVFGGYARQVDDKQRNDLRTFDYYALPTGGRLPEPVVGIRVIEAQGQELSLVERHFVRTERGLVLRSDDLTRGSLPLSELDDQYRAAGLERRRITLVALRRDEPVGFALCEISSLGLNLSELLSSFRVQLLPGLEGPEARAVRVALVRAALSLYHLHGRPFAALLATAGEVDPAAGATVTASKQYCCWTCHRTLFRAFAEHVDRLYELLNARQNRGERANHVVAKSALFDTA